jgi:NifU-like protein
LCNNLVVGLYPERVVRITRGPKNIGTISPGGASGRAASFRCGAAVVIDLRISDDPAIIEAGRFRTSGCGYMIAAADVLISMLCGRRLEDLRSTTDEEILPLLRSELGIGEDKRNECLKVVVEALREALAHHRESVVSQYHGDTPLICSCFGISEDTIIETISSLAEPTVSEICETTKAGTGCGSCRMVIQSLIDASRG